MDASLHSQARGSFRRRPILAGSGCFGKDRYPLRILEIARTSERAEKPPELRLSAPGLDGEARPPTPTGSALRDAAGLGSVFERLTSFEELAAAWNVVLAKDILDQRLRRQAKEIGADLDVFLGRLSAELRTGLYKPGPLYPLKRERLGPLRGGLGAPVLWVPSLRDDIVERAVAAAVARLPRHCNRRALSGRAPGSESTPSSAASPACEAKAARTSFSWKSKGAHPGSTSMTLWKRSAEACLASAR